MPTKKQAEELQESVQSEPIPDKPKVEAVSKPVPPSLADLKAKLINLGLDYANKLKQGQTLNSAQIDTLKALHELYTVLNDEYIEIEDDTTTAN